MRHVLRVFAAACLTAVFAGCSAGTSAPGATGDEQDLTSDAATLALTADHKTNLVGTPTAGKGVVVAYALERLPQCRGNVGGGGPAWNVTGFYSENGAAPKMFEVSTLTASGKDRVATAGRIVPREAGDLAIWFQISSSFGCSAFDSELGRNYHLTVAARAPDANAASIVLGQDGKVSQTGNLKAGGRVTVRYEQARLPDCRRVERGSPAWNITGFAQIDRETPRTFDTGVAVGPDRKEVDALVELPHAGELSLWFQVVGLGGCMKFDSNAGANYRFRIAE